MTRVRSIGTHWRARLRRSAWAGQRWVSTLALLCRQLDDRLNDEAAWWLPPTRSNGSWCDAVLPMTTDFGLNSAFREKIFLNDNGMSRQNGHMRTNGRTDERAVHDPRRRRTCVPQTELDERAHSARGEKRSRRFEHVRRHLREKPRTDDTTMARTGKIKNTTNNTRADKHRYHWRRLRREGRKNARRRQRRRQQTTNDGCEQTRATTAGRVRRL